MHIGALKHCPAVSIDYFALLGDNIVIINHVFTDVEVVSINLCLGLFDKARDHAAFQWHALFHPNHFHYFRHAVGGKAAHQLVIKSEEETRLTGVALASGASTQLVIDTARLVPLGTDDVQPSQSDHALMILFALAHL